MNDIAEISLSRWLLQIERICMQLNTFSVNIIVDQAGDVPPLVQDLKRFQPQIKWVSLFENQPENEFIDDAPLFLQLRIDIWQHKEWLFALLRQYYHPERVLMFFSINDFGSLAKHLQKLTIVEWEERKGMMRFYDARVFPTLLESILTGQQKNYFLAIAQFWGWRDRTGNPVWLRGENHDYDFNNTVSVNLTDAQYSQLGMISDIEGFIYKNKLKYTAFTSQALFDYLWYGMKEAGEEIPLDHDVFFTEYLSRTLKLMDGR